MDNTKKNMKGEYKKFSKTLFRLNDPKTRRLVMDYFNRQKIVLTNNVDQYGVDLMAEDGSMSVEVEHRHSWKTDEFPFADVNVPERKAKYFVENNVHYVILSENFSHIGMIAGKKLRKYITDETLTECSNKFVKKGELFYKVPKSEFTWDKL